jgi:hypothetical protein
MRTQSGSSITFDDSVSGGRIERHSPSSPAIVVSPDPQESDDEFAVERDRPVKFLRHNTRPDTGMPAAQKRRSSSP